MARRSRAGTALAVVLLSSLAAPLAAQPTPVTLLHIGDTRSHLAAGGPKDARLAGSVGGLARTATLLRLVRSVDEASVLLHAGNLVSGDLAWNAFRGVPELQLLRALGLDAIAIGGRDLAFGPEVLAELLSSMNQGSERFTMLAANLDTSGCVGRSCGALQWIEPSQLVEVAGVRIGVFALTAPDDPTVAAAPLALLGRGNPSWIEARAFEAAAALRQQGAQVVVLLSRLGRAADTALAARQPGPLIDVVIEGLGDEVLHQPLAVAGPGGHETRIVAAGARYEHVGRLRLVVDGPRVAVVEYSLLKAGPWIEPDPAVELLVGALERQIVARQGEDVYGVVVGRALRDIDGRVDPSRRPRDSALGNLVSGAYRWKARAELGLTANGFLGDGLPRGPLVGADLFRVVGHAWDGATREPPPLVRLSLKGAQLLAAIEGSLAQLDKTDALLLQVSGLRYRYDSSLPAGRRLVPGSVLVRGEPLDPLRVYSVATAAALADLLQRVLGVEVEGRVELGTSEYAALRDYVMRAGSLAVRSEGRILDVAARP